jgi:hypothetical protein
MQSVPITTEVVTSNSAQGEVRSIQYCVIKFDLRQICGFAQGSPVFSTNKTSRYDITEILLKVALNTITITLLHVTCNTLITFATRPFLFMNGTVYSILTFENMSPTRLKNTTNWKYIIRLHFILKISLIT